MDAAAGGYIALLRTAAVGRLFWWVSLVRLQFGVMPLALLLLLAERRGSFAEAGAALAAFGLSAGLLGPARARLADRCGAGRTLVAFALLLAAALGLVVHVASAPLAVLVACSLGAGALLPPAGPVVRREWRHLFGDRDGEPEGRLRTAYSLDAVDEEALFVVGPLVAAAAATRFGAAATLIGSAALLVLATIVMVRSLTSRTPAAGTAGVGVARLPALWRAPRFLAGLLPAVGLGVLLGGVEIAAVAAALGGAGQAAAGVPAAALSVGGIVGGLVFGRGRWPGGAAGQAVALTVAAGVAVAVAGALTSLFPAMVAALGLAGLCVAPAIVCSYLVADEASVAPGAETTAWVDAAFNTGFAAGTLLAGTALAHVPAGPAMWLVVGASVLVVAASLAAGLGRATRAKG